jgi:catechol 2,3-dioxygenase-like lactoylglutathione lyase family enzyme
VRTRLTQARANTRDIDKAIEWYTTVLGFEVDILWPDDEPTYVQFAVQEGAAFSLAVDSRPSLGRFNFLTSDVEGEWNRLRERVTVIEPLFTTPYGSTKFTIADLDGNELGFVKDG